MNERERRCVSAELRASGDGIEGYAAVFDSPATIGESFVESIDPGAFADVLASGEDTKGLYNHSDNYVLASTAAGTMELSTDRVGLRYRIPTLPKARGDVAEAIARRDVRGSSFSFTVAPGGDEWSQSADRMPHRRILRIARLFDVGPVVWPAYGDTTVSARSLERARSEPTRPRRTLTRDEAARQLGAARARLADLDAHLAVVEGRGRGTSPAGGARPDARTAFHEAGHCLGVLLTGGRITGVAHRGGGWTTTHAHRSGNVQRGALVYLAGRAAENVHRGTPGALPPRTSADHAQASRALRSLGLDPEMWMRRELEYAERLVGFYWPAVDALARELMRCGAMNGRDAERTLWDALARETDRRLFVGEDPQWGRIRTPAMTAVL